MKQFLHKLAFVMLTGFLITSCSKDEPDIEQNNTDSLSLVASEASPGDVIEIKTGKTTALEEVSVILGAQTVKAYSVDENTYSFILPVIATGKYDLKIPDINPDKTLSLTVKTYTPIAKPQDIIDDYIVNRDKCFEKIINNTSNITPVTPETVILINQIKEEWDYQFSQATDKDKELMAYVLQKNEVDPEWFNNTSTLPDTYFSKIAISTDAGEELVRCAKQYVAAQSVCVATIPCLAVTGWAFVKFPNFATGGLFLAAFSTFIISREAAIYKSGEVATLKGVAEAVSDIFSKKAAVLELTKNVESGISMNVLYRNLKADDSKIQTDITNAFNGETIMGTKDSELKKMYQKAVKNTQKLKGLYPSYIAVIGKKSDRSMTVPVLDKDIIIKGTNDPNIVVTSVMMGSELKIKAVSTSTKDVTFNLTVAYKRALDKKEITKEISCLLKASPVVIGDSFQGGVLGYIFQPGDKGYVANEIHGLIITPPNYVFPQPQYSWCNGCDYDYIGNNDFVQKIEAKETGATDRSLGAGLANTNKIVATQGSGTYAAKICYDLVYNGYSDWFLPSSDEFAKLAISSDILYLSGYHWTSCELGNSNTYIAIEGSYYENFFKNAFFDVRPVRQF